jgi:epoxide hydrolase-like predicted phosphatase
MPDQKALVVDYGGVLTNSLAETMGGWLAADGIDPAAFGAAMRDLLGAETAAGNPVHALERGELEIPDFERQLARHLVSTDGSPVQPEGLLARMFRGFRAADDMVGVVRRARDRGLKTALLSNSWGMDYPREGWDQLFDVTVISGEVGMRKPDPEIYLLCSERLGLSPEQCVFVDDLPPNVRGAAAVGMVGVLHRSYDDTVAELEVLLGLDLRE